MIDPHPVIPQSREQAAQRDNRHQLDTRPPETPEGQTARLRAAIRTHQTTIQDAGPLANAGELTPEQQDTMARKHAADQTLWGHLHP